MLQIAMSIILAGVSGLGTSEDCIEPPFAPNDKALEAAHSLFVDAISSREGFDDLFRRFQANFEMDEIETLSTVTYKYYKGRHAGLYEDEYAMYMLMFMGSLLTDQMSDIEELRSGLRLIALNKDFAAQRAARVRLSFANENSTRIESARYEPYLEECFDSKTQTVQNLVDFLFQRNAIEALPLVLKFADVDDERQADLIRANAIAEEFYPEYYMAAFPKDEGIPEPVSAPEKAVAFLKAVRGDEWWLPLYVADVVRKVEAFQTEEVLAWFETMEHPVIEETFRAIELRNPSKPILPTRWMVFQENKE